jgi:hypothetical protein
VVIAPHVDDAVSDGRRGEHGIAGRVAPYEGPGGGVEGVEVPILAPYVEHPVGDGGGRVYVGSGRVAPQFRPGGGVEGVDVVVNAVVFNAPDVDDAVNDGGG